MTVAAFWPLFLGEHTFLAWDDVVNVSENPFLLVGGLEGLQGVWRVRVLGVFEPVASTIKWLLVQRFGVTPLPFHLTSLALHVVSAILCWHVGRRLLRRVGFPDDRAWLGGLLAGILFAVHPLRVEVVAWVSGQPYALAGVCTLLTVWAYLCFLESTGARRWIAWGASLVGYALALSSKAAAIFVPLMLLVLDCYPYRRPRFGKLLVEKIPFVAVLSAFAWMTLQATEHAQADNAFALDAWNRVALVGHQLVFYPFHTLWPAGLMPVYPVITPDFSPLSPHFLLCWSVVIAGGALVWRQRVAWPWLGASLAVYVAGILPVSGIVDHGLHVHAADRYGYLSMLGLWVVLGGLMCHPRVVPTLSLADRRTRTLTVCGCGLLVLLGGLTARQTWTWRSSASLWSACVDVDPANALALNQLGYLHLADGDLDAARPLLRRAVSLQPQAERYVLNLGATLEHSGDLHGARQVYVAYLVHAPTSGVGHFNLGVIEQKLGHARSARVQFMLSDRYGFVAPPPDVP